MDIIKEENKQVKDLKKLLQYHDDLYYIQDTPDITDAEYDALKKKYLELTGQEEYEYVPGEAAKGTVKYTHTTHVSSLGKIQITETEKLRAELKRLWPVVIQPKMDGLTVVSYPDADVTRGNGTIGENITENMKKVSGKGTVVQLPTRSEVVMLLSDFAEINRERVAAGEEPFKNPRNAAAGMLRQKDSSKVKGLTCFAYNILRAEEVNDANNQVYSLAMLGWNVVDSYQPEDIEDAIDYILNYDRGMLDYEIDGLVIKHNGQKKFGATGHHPKNAIAIKFEAQGEWTRIKNIIWQVGRTGKLTPVAEFEPVDILGSTVTRATLHNYAIMEGLDLTTIYSDMYHRTLVKVIKANDVIPAIVEVRHVADEGYTLADGYEKQIFKQKLCPECQGEVEEINDQDFCTNPLCGAKLLNSVTHLAKRDAFNIEGLSEETAKKLIAKYKELHEDELSIHPSFIFTLTYDNILSIEGFAEKSAKKLYDNIQNSLKVDFDKFLYGCGMPLVGRSVSKDIAAYYSQYESAAGQFAMDYIDDKLKDVVQSLEGIGEEIANSLINNYQTHIVPFGFFDDLEINNIKVAKKAENQLTFVITGTLENPRKYYEELVTKAGHKLSGSVSKKTSYVLVGEDAGSKKTKAEELKIPILTTESELINIIGD